MYFDRRYAFVSALVALFILIVHFSLSAQWLNKYGKELTVVKNVNIGSCADAAVNGNVLYVIAGEALYSFDISVPGNPVLLDSLEGLGNVRQIEVQGGFAYITSREEGMFIVDVSNPKKIRLSSHYDTLELGTGIAVSGSLAAVSNRQYGTELVDISNKENPKFLGSIRTGEAQSVFIKDTLLFVGNWGEQSIAICDIADPRKPELISTIPLDGFGDGIFVRGNLCYAATGHHARGFKNYLDREDPASGKGHGMEIIDVSNPYKPIHLSVVKFPPQFRRHFDYWDVQVTGDFAIVGDAESGLFVVNVSDPEAPVLTAHRKFPLASYQGKEIHSPVGGFALGNRVVYAATRLTGLYVVDATNVSTQIQPGESVFHGVVYKSDRRGPYKYVTEGSVYSVSVSREKNVVYIAAGQSGVHKVRLKPFLEGEKILNTGSVVFDLSIVGDTMYLAEGNSGFSVWELNRNVSPKLLGRYKPAEGGVYQLLISLDKRKAALHVGGNVLDIIDISNPREIVRKAEFKKNAPMYRLPLSHRFLKGDVIACKWHVFGSFAYDLNALQPELTKICEATSIIDGVAGYKDKLLIIKGGGYEFRQIFEQEDISDDDTMIVKVNAVGFHGKPTIFGSHLYVSNRMSGDVLGLDISSIRSPRAMWKIKLSGNPGFVIQYQDMLLIPAGREGLLVYDAVSGQPYYPR